MHFSKLSGVDFRPLDDLDLSDPNISDWVNARHFLGDLLLDDLTGEEIEKLGGIRFCHFLCDNVVDALSDLFLLGSQGVVGLAFLVGGFLGEGDHENSDDVAILGFAVLDGFNQGSTLLDQS